MKIIVFWVVALCSLVIALMMEVASTSETSVISTKTTRRYNPEDSHILSTYAIVYLCQSGL
jgi:hypothetical protein